MIGLRRTTPLLLLIFLISFFASALAQGPVTLDVNLDQDPFIIDPTANWLYDVPANMFVPLLDYDYENGEVLPAGATSWAVSEDGKTYTFTIRGDWAWSDGTPVTAADYANSFRRIVDPAVAAPMAYRVYIIDNAKEINTGELSDLDALGVRVVDDHTLEVELTEPAAWFLSSLSSIGHAVPQWAIDAHGEDWTNPENVVVNGPFTLTELVTEDVAVLEKNPSYYGADDVGIDKINLYVVKEASTAMAMYENGELDTVSVPPPDLDRVRGDSVLSQEYYNGPKYILYYYLFNVLEPPFDNELVRKAFAAAVDKQAIVSFITKGGEVPAGTLVPPGSVGHIPNSEGIGIPFNAEQAQALLAEAGYPGGEGLPKITLAFNASEIHSNIAQAVQIMWQDTLGAEVELQSVEGRAYSQIAAEGAFNVWRMGWGMDYPDAHNIHAEIFHSNVGSPAIVKIPEYDSIIDEAAVEADPARRLELYKQAEQLLVEEQAGTIPIYWYAENLLTKPDVDRVLAPSFNREFWKWTVSQ
jgi:oligopeptide transport system substrate-binding protein